MKIKYCCTYWGSENEEAESFVDKVLSAGYEGIEINLPTERPSFSDAFLAELEDIQEKNPGFLFIAQQLTAPDNDTVDDYIRRMQKSLRELAAFRPHFINSHTGRDYFSFDDNCRVLEAAMTISSQTGVRILHETHRGRFSFHAASLIPYLKTFPELELVGDFSHFCTVSESMLHDQEDILQQIIPHVSHLHARIGHEQAPQVSDPFAPEWRAHLQRFEEWWQQVIQHKHNNGWPQFSITTEFGPPPYMPAVPFTRQPLGNQWQINVNLMQHLRKRFH